MCWVLRCLEHVQSIAANCEGRSESIRPLGEGGNRINIAASCMLEGVSKTRKLQCNNAK
jgi:hypothetical protein